jgi:hypothetical protein
MDMTRQIIRVVMGIAVIVSACGCASLVTNRGVVVTPVAMNTNDGLELFRNTANQLGLVVQEPFYTATRRYYYSALPPTNRVNNLLHLHFLAASPPTNQVDNRLHLSMEVDEKGALTFSAVIYGTANDFPAAQSAAALFEQELDKRHIKYKVWQATAYPPP